MAAAAGDRKIRFWEGRKEERKEEASTDGDGTKENLGECPAGRHHQ
jgi:hypothetical protein